MPRERLNVVDLFAGCGALSTGFAGVDVADYNTVCANEMNREAAESLGANHRTAAVLAGDVRRINAAEINEAAGLGRHEIDVVVGGPPCQGFSTAGKRMTADPRNSLFLEFVRLVRELRPRVAVMENVPQFLSVGKGRYQRLFQKQMLGAGYITESMVLVASDYGVPQTRNRVFCISVERGAHDESITFPSPTHQKIRDAVPFQRGDAGIVKPPDSGLKRFVSVSDAIGDLPSLDNGTGSDRYRARRPTPYQADRRKAQKSLTEHECRSHGRDLLSYISKIPEGGRMIDRYDEARWKGKGFRQAYGRLHRNGIGGTITASFHNPGSGRFIHYNDVRAISIREAARLQGFDDDYVFTGTKTQKQLQIGNAVPPLLARSVAEHVYKTIFRKQAVPAILPGSVT